MRTDDVLINTRKREKVWKTVKLKNFNATESVTLEYEDAGEYEYIRVVGALFSYRFNVRNS